MVFVFFARSLVQLLQKSAPLGHNVIFDSSLVWHTGKAGLDPWAGPMGWADGLGVITGEHKVSTHKLCLCLRSAQYLTCGVCFARSLVELLQKSAPLGHNVIFDSSLVLFLSQPRNCVLQDGENY